jgi:formate dehydrogenase maturation protein FdhE
LGMRNRPLDPVQRQLVEEIARVQAEPCDFCHSRRWRAPYEVEVSTGEWNFVVRCANCEDSTSVVSLSREEAASRLGLIHGHQRTIDETSG